MKLRIFAIVVAAGACLWAAQDAHAGAIRYTGEQIGKGTVAIAQTTSDAAQAAGGGVASAGKATGGALKTGVVAVGKGAKETPGLVARGASSAVKGLAKAIW
ncbi:MAG: hypothetical protein LAN62_18840 [Acidobacteriia bacterium]|nr:hypothetical protein [Terriglobia bacterium]